MANYYNGYIGTTAAVTGAAKKNKGGTVFQGGNIDGVNMTNDLSIGESAYNSPGFGGRVTAVSGVTTCNSAGLLAQMTAGRYVMLGNNVTQYLANVATTVLASPGADFGRGNSIFQAKTQRTTFLSALSWTANSGGEPTYTFTKTQSTVFLSGIVPTEGDNAANPTAAVPGQLVYRNGRSLPYQDTYKPRYNY